MGNSYTALSTQDQQDILMNGHNNMKTSASVLMKRPPIKRPAMHKDNIACLVAQRPGMVVSGSRDKTMRLNSVDTGEVFMVWSGHENEVTKIAYKFRGNKHFLVSGSRDEKVMLWTFATNTPLKTFEGHTKTVCGIVANDDGHIISASRDTTIRKWDAESGKQICFNSLSRNLCTHLSLNASTHMIAQSSEDKSVKLWDERDLHLTAQFTKKNNIQTYVEFLPDGCQLVSCSNGFNGDGCEISLYDVRNQKLLREYRGHEETVTSVCILGGANIQATQQFTQRRLMMSTSYDRSVRIWNMDEGICLWNHDGSEHHGALYASLAFPDGCIVVSGADASLVTMQMHARAGRPVLQTLTYTQQRSSSLDRT